MEKYARLRRRVQAELDEIELSEPELASDEVLALAHDLDYIQRVSTGGLSPREQRTIGFPWSPQMVERSRRSVGATLGACAAALAEGVAVNLAGGTHHAMRDGGQGYCVFNDAAVATRVLQTRYGPPRRLRVGVIDLDVHQGNGTASILAGDDATFTLSIHCESNFPFRKERSNLDVGLIDGTGDREYLQALDSALANMLSRFDPQFLIYLAGADAHAGDRLGRLKLSTDGLARRDDRVFDFAQRLGVPIAVAMAGGYGHDIDQTVAVHFNTVHAARDSWRARNRLSQEHDS
ncbi:MAG TPA: histone deacetylase [Burkholderiaceae bacterium]|nr:histone deacetylase [Burkholderiaceae bacterium]